MALFHTLHSLRSLNFDLLNTANIILLPKKVGAEKISDYRPISLIHSVVKLFTKMLALRLAPAMKDIISKSQSAFIKGRSIHDNFHLCFSTASPASQSHMEEDCVRVTRFHLCFSSLRLTLYKSSTACNGSRPPKQNMSESQ